jgi:hypothetical protein
MLHTVTLSLAVKRRSRRHHEERDMAQSALQPLAQVTLHRGVVTSGARHGGQLRGRD